MASSIVIGIDIAQALLDRGTIALSGPLLNVPGACVVFVYAWYFTYILVRRDGPQ